MVVLIATTVRFHGLESDSSNLAEPLARPQLQVAFQYMMITSYRPLRDALPLSLAHLSYGMNVEKHQTDSFLEAQARDTSMLAQDEDAERDASNQKNGDTELARISTDANTAGGDSAVGLTDNQRDVEMAQLGEVSDGVVAQDFAGTQPANPEGNAQPSLGESARPEDTLEEDAFSHPATKEPQRVIWLPLDELGLADAEVRDNEMVGIRSTHRDAVLNNKVSCAEGAEVLAAIPYRPFLNTSGGAGSRRGQWSATR
jgi:hypothetical protein